MTKKEILKMWEKYHEICSLYRGKPLPSLFEYENIPSHSDMDEIKATERNLEIAKKNGLLTVGGTEFKGMYSKAPICVGDYSTPEASLKALLSYKTKLKKRKAMENKNDENK